jgi:protocatechuate 3,4-dioxygenase, alpha subunit
MSLWMTGSQTVGPFFKIGMSWLYRAEIGCGARHGERFRVRGLVLDGDGTPVPDAIVELWQADTQGRYATGPDGEAISEAEFSGFGRVPTDAQGVYEFRTVKPGRVQHPSGQLQAPHVSVTVFMRGLLKPVHTRLYFPDEPSNASDPVLAQVPESRRATLIAKADSDPSSAESLLSWDVRLQGVHETVFFTY